MLIGMARDQREIMADQQQAQPVVAQPRQRLHDRVTQMRVERTGRLVGDEQRWAVRDGGGDQHALALAAGQAMRIGVELRFGLGQPDLVEHRRAAPPDPALARPAPSLPRSVARRSSDAV